MVLPVRTIDDDPVEHLADHNDEIRPFLVAVPANNQTANYTLVLADAGKVVEMNGGSALVVTVPANSTTPFMVGTVVEVWQQGAGQVSVVPASGVTFVYPPSGGLKCAEQHASLSLRKRDTDQWAVEGGVV